MTVIEFDPPGQPMRAVLRAKMGLHHVEVPGMGEALMALCRVHNGMRMHHGHVDRRVVHGPPTCLFCVAMAMRGWIPR